MHCSAPLEIPHRGLAAPSPGRQLELVVPSMEHLPGYLAARRREWTAAPAMNNEASVPVIEQAPLDFLRSLHCLEPAGLSKTLPSGRQVPQLPSFCRWLWDGEFCGVIRFRWQPGSAELPTYCKGHIGYSVVPWKRKLGYARAALALMLDEARALGLPYVELTPYETNNASRRVIEANGGVLQEAFQVETAQGPVTSLRYRIAL